MKEKISKIYHDTLEAYENIGGDYAIKNQSPSLSLDLILEFVKPLSPGNLILDAGCGHGRDLKLFHELGFKAIGIDYSSEMIKVAKSNVPDSSKILQMDLLNMEFSPSYFDGIWSNAVLHHLSEGDIKTVLKDFNTVLKPNGVVFISVRKNSKPIFDREYSEYPRYYNSMNVKKMNLFLIETGFDIKKVSIQETRQKSWIQIFASKI